MPFVYLLARKPYGTLYVGSTIDLARRVFEYKNKAIPGFTAKYGIDHLVWFEAHEMLEPLGRGSVKSRNGSATGKIALIERENPHRIDLYPSLSYRAIVKMGPGLRRDGIYLSVEKKL